jgi:diguanylate cyclase (GGDEF)-like protein
MRENLAGAAGDRFENPASFEPRNPLNLLIVGGILLIAAIVVGTCFAVVEFRQRALFNSERELQNTVLLLARHFDRELDGFDAVQRDLVRRLREQGIRTTDAFNRQMSGKAAHDALEALVRASPETARLHIFDADGRLINSSVTWPPPAIDITDRNYFRRFKTDPGSPDIAITPIRSRFAEGWTTVIARRITASDGTFLGVVSRGMTPASFEKFFESLSFGEGSAITMEHRDGTMLARYPHVEDMIGENLSTAPIQTLLRGTDHGTIQLQSPIDGEDRLASTRTLSEFPLSIIATMTLSTALADWRVQTRFLIGAAALAALAIALTLLLIVRKLRAQHRRAERRLAVEKERLDTAINNMPLGLLLYDSDSRIVLHNQRYLDIFDLSPDVVKPGMRFRDLMAYRKSVGSFKGDIEMFCANIERNVVRGKKSHHMIETDDGRSIETTTQPLRTGGWIATQEDITERRTAERQIAHLAHYDALTDLPNRVLFRERLGHELERTKRGEQLAMLYIDIDEFKAVNDSLGHAVGDELLKAVALRLRGCVREMDFVARLGGDEFAIVQTNVEQPDDVMGLVKRIYDEIREPFDCLGHRLSTDASIGIALAPHDGADLDQLLKSADLAMYGAKADGRRTYRFFEPEMDARVKARRTLELDMRQAIVDGGGFELHYQPVVDLQRNEVVGCEALLRWRHPERGLISPAEFIPIAEETGMICEIGDWALATACAEAMHWPTQIRLAVNVSPVQFRSHAFSLKVANVLATTGLAARRLELEITEAVLIRDDDVALNLLQHLRDLGVRIALDDFGTGYSSLSYLRRFPFDKIKIDRCFVDGIEQAGGSSAIVQAVINIAIAQNMTTTAEGIETDPQREMLRDLGCTEMQGFLFSRPLPVEGIRTLLLGAADKRVA